MVHVADGKPRGATENDSRRSSNVIGARTSRPLDRRPSARCDPDRGRRPSPFTPARARRSSRSLQIGDKTFFIAAVLAMRHSRAVIFTGAVGALALMTVLSAIMGFALPSLMPRK